VKRKKLLITGLLILISAVIYSADRDQLAMEFIKNCIEKAKLEYGYTHALRYFQYTATTEKNNPWSYVLSSYGEDALADSKIEKAEKGKYISVLKDRSAKRIKKIWQANKEDIFNAVPADIYNNTIGFQIGSYIEFYESGSYKRKIKAMMKKSPRLDNKTIDKAGEITQWENYKELAFWYRRTKEKNDRVVYEIMKELREHYKQ